MTKIEKTILEFKAEGIPIDESHILAKSMNFHEPSNVEKDFQNVSRLFFRIPPRATCKTFHS